MICQYCGHKLTDGKCTYPACPGRLRRENVSELKPDIHNIEAITLKKFADRHGLIMEVHERRRPISDPARYYACFKNSEIEESGFLMSAFGDGSTPDEAISNYIKRIEFKLLVIDAYTSNRRKIEVPRIIIPHPAPAEVERLVDDLLSVSKQLGQSEARGLYDHIEPAEVAINDLKSRLLAALSNTTPLSQNVPVEELEAGRKVQHLQTKTVWTITRVGDYGTHIISDDWGDEIFPVSSNNPLRYYRILPVTTRSFFRGHPVIKSADGAWIYEDSGEPAGFDGTIRPCNVKGVYKYEIDSPDELDAGLHGFRDEVTVIVDSGEPGGDPTGEDSFEEYMRQALIEWYDGAGVTLKKEGD